MGQCVSRNTPGQYSFSRHYDAESCASISSGRFGHSESKGARKREKSASGNGNKQSRGVATSFGFRRRPASTSRADDNARKRNNDRNGNRGSSEDLRAEEVFSGRSTPLARPRKETAGQPLRSNRFGLRQGNSKTARVGDVPPATAEPAFADTDSHYNNNALDKKSTNPTLSQPPMPTQVTTSGTTTIVGASGQPKTVTKQTIILTYQSQPVAPQDRSKPSRGEPQSRAPSATRAAEAPRAPGKYTFQSSQLPRPQYPAVKNIDVKTAKQVVNNTRKANADGWREGASSAVSTDSGVWTGGEGGAGGESPRSRRRPRNLEMVMRGTHNFHLRELQYTDLDIMDDAVITGHAVIPLPKLPSSFDQSPECEVPTATYSPPSPILAKPSPAETQRNSPMSTLERYRNRSRPTRIQSTGADEEKFVLDRAQPEKLDKQKSFIKSSSGVASPATVDSSKESSPSCKSEESHFGHSGAWQNHTAGEAMANRSQDDVSLALSISSCEDDKSKLELHREVEVPKKTIVIMDDPPVPHPLLMKSITLSQHSTMLGSMTSSNYSTTSTCTNQSGDHHNLTLTLEEPKFDMTALETSTQSLLDDETSPADSLISSTSTSGDSNNELLERDALTVSSSAYQTANTKSKTPDLVMEETDGVDGETFSIKEISHEPQNLSSSKPDSPLDRSPPSPGSPAHASASLSLSDGRDYFDDEIADQPALLFRKNSESSPSKKAHHDLDGSKLRRSRDRIPASPLVQRHRRLGGDRNIAAERTTSLDTLSSLASDDMMMDNDLAQSITSLQSVDDYIERLDSSFRSGLNSLDEKQLCQEFTSQNAVRQWSQLFEQNSMLDRQLAAMSGKGDSLAASTNSLASVTSLGASLPVRTARLLNRSRTQTPSDVGAGSDGAASPAPAPAILLQDVVDIKTLLLQLKRVLQEPGEERQSLSSETLDPLLAACAESPARGNGRRPPPASPLPRDACADMRRQILYLQSQLEERDRLVRVLQQQMLRMSEGHEPRSDDSCNAATQTERLRAPMATGMTSSENTGLVSWNEQASTRRLPTYSEAQKTKRAVPNGVKCSCGARRTSGADDADKTDLRTSSRVGSKYLQAVANNNENTTRRYIKRDSSVGEKTSERRSLYSSRSRSIENFQTQNFSVHEPNLAKKPVIEENILKHHHTSYGDLYNGRISSKESVNGNRHSPSLNGQSTDTDYSSDGGYKSLPSSINCNGGSPKRVSGIPRRSIEQKFLLTKHVKASAV